MPSFNHEEFVASSVESVLSQSFGDLELVVTDDGSTDGTADMVRSFRDPRIRLEVFDRNLGACAAVNDAIERSRGEFIAILTSDDYFLPEKIAQQVEFLDRNPDLGAVFGLPRFVDARGTPLGSSAHSFSQVFTAKPENRYEWLAHFFLHGNAICHPTILIRREVYRHVGLYDPMLRQLPDFDMWIRVCGRYDIRVLDQELTAFRVLPNHRNTSAPSEPAVRRACWEEHHVLRRFLRIDDVVLERALGPHMPEDVARRLLPVHTQVAMLAIRQNAPHRQAFGLAVLEELVRCQAAGIDVKEFHELSGRANPFRTGWKRRRRLKDRIRRIFGGRPSWDA